MKVPLWEMGPGGGGRLRETGHWLCGGLASSNVCLKLCINGPSKCTIPIISAMMDLAPNVFCIVSSSIKIPAVYLSSLDLGNNFLVKGGAEVFLVVE